MDLVLNNQKWLIYLKPNETNSVSAFSIFGFILITPDRYNGSHKIVRETSCSLVANVLDCNIVESEFEP